MILPNYAWLLFLSYMLSTTSLQSSSICTFDNSNCPSHKMASRNPTASASWGGGQPSYQVVAAFTNLPRGSRIHIPVPNRFCALKMAASTLHFRNPAACGCHVAVSCGECWLCAVAKILTIIIIILWYDIFKRKDQHLSIILCLINAIISDNKYGLFVKIDLFYIKLIFLSLTKPHQNFLSHVQVV